MSRSRRVAVSVGLAVAVGAACGPADQAPPPSAAAPVAGVTGPDLAVQRLDRVADATEPAMPRRNPFMFGARQGGDKVRTAAQAPLPPPDGLPMLPLPLATPPLRLLGFVTLTDGARVAVLTVGSDLVMARVGEVIARRFRVVEIGQETVALTDAVGERPVRLSLP